MVGTFLFEFFCDCQLWVMYLVYSALRLTDVVVWWQVLSTYVYPFCKIIDLICLNEICVGMQSIFALPFGIFWCFFTGLLLTWITLQGMCYNHILHLTVALLIALLHHIAVGLWPRLMCCMGYACSCLHLCSHDCFECACEITLITSLLTLTSLLWLCLLFFILLNIFTTVIYSWRF